METKELFKKNNLAIQRRIINRIKVLEIIPPGVNVHDPIFNLKLTK